MDGGAFQGKVIFAKPSEKDILENEEYRKKTGMAKNTDSSWRLLYVSGEEGMD